MAVTVLYFAKLRDLVRLDEELLDVERSMTVGEFGAQLMARHGALVLDGVRFAVNEEFASEEQMVCDGDVVALIPPVSGG